MERFFAGKFRVWLKYMLYGIMDWLHRWVGEAIRGKIKTAPD
jgi:hypothetical protein